MERPRHPVMMALSGCPSDLSLRLFLLGLALAQPPLLPAVEMPGMNMSDMDMADMPTGDVAAGRKLAEAQCGGCHGPKGLNGSADYPLLAGQNAMYLAGSLGAYRSGARRSDAMMPVAMSLSDQDIANLAAYFAACPMP